MARSIGIGWARAQNSYLTSPECQGAAIGGLPHPGHDATVRERTRAVPRLLERKEGALPAPRVRKHGRRSRAVSIPADQPSFLAGGGEVGALMRARDWGATPLGSTEAWPEALRTMVAMVLRSPLLSTLLWGPDLRMLYNDAYIPALGERHPSALGQPVSEVWAGVAWEQFGPNILRVWQTGEAICEARYALPMSRQGQTTVTYWNYSLAPIRDGQGVMVGVLNQAVEISEQVETEKRQTMAEWLLRTQNSGLQEEVTNRTAERNRLWETTTDLMGTATVDGFMRAINPAWTRLLGWSEDELLAMPFSRIVHPDDLAAVDGLIERIKEGRPIVSFTIGCGPRRAANER